MLLEPGFFAALERAFQQFPICSVPPRRSSFLPASAAKRPARLSWRSPRPTDFPVRCDEPIPGEDRSYVLYGSGGCSLYDTAKLRALGQCR